MNKLTSYGKVYLVGAGPGAADLITVRGAKLLARADIVFHDALVEPEMLALCPQAITVSVGKRCGKLSLAQQFINKRLVDAAKKYSTVVRLKGGDPMLFGRADEEIQALDHADIEIEVVPGITAALAGAASLQQSLTLRGVSRSVAFVTLAQATNNTPTNPTHGPLKNPSADTLVYYMGRKDAGKIAKQLMTNSPNLDGATPVHILEAVSTSRERHWSSTLEDLTQGAADQWFDSESPALIMVGQALQEKAHAKAKVALERAGAKVNDSLQNSLVLAHRKRRA